MRFLRFLLLCAFSASVQAQEPPAVEPARFLIETITVESSRKASAGIIEAETLLKEGGTYSEDDLRQAVSRVHRLPFVLDATFSLRKGSERDTYELVIQANTARWFFFDRSVQLVGFDQTYNLGSFGDDDSFSFGHSGLIGGRIFVGRAGVLYGSWGFQRDLTSDSDGARIGYTHYNLFGRGIAADVSFATNGCCTTQVIPFGIDPNLSTWEWLDDDQASMSVSVPLSPRRSLQLGWSERHGQALDHARVLAPFFGDQEDFIFDGDQDSRHLEARWVQDTSDEPILPSRGTVLSAGLVYDAYEARDLRADRYVRGPDGTLERVGQVDLPDFEGEQLLATASAIRHWSVTPRQSVSAGGQISAGRSRLTNLRVDDLLMPETDLDVYGGSVSGRHLLRLWALREPGNMGDLYLDTNVIYSVEATSPDLGLRNNPLTRLELSTGITFRNQWGRLRLLFTYLDLGEVLQ